MTMTNRWTMMIALHQITAFPAVCQWKMIAIHSGGNSITWWIDVQSDSISSTQHSFGDAPLARGWEDKEEGSKQHFMHQFAQGQTAVLWQAMENNADNLMLFTVRHPSAAFDDCRSLHECWWCYQILMTVASKAISSHQSLCDAICIT